MTGPHFAISFFRYLASSEGVEPTALDPRLSSFALTAGSANVATVAAFIFAMIEAGVRAGTNSPHHGATSKPGKPDSASVGTSGAAATRLAV